MIEVEYCRDFPEEVKQALDPILMRFLPVMPSYIRVLWVEFDERAPHNGETAAQDGKWEYGFCKIWVKPDWLRCGPRDREESVVHELVHSILMPLDHACRDIIGALVAEDSPASNISHIHMTKHLEMVTQGLAEAFHNATKG